MYLQPTHKLKEREVQVLMLFRDTETLPMDAVFSSFENRTDTFHAIKNHIREGVFKHDEIEKSLSLTEVGISEIKMLKTPKRKTKSNVKLNDVKLQEVIQVARDAKAYMLKNLRNALPRTELQKRLIAKERKRELWQYVISHHEVQWRVKRLSTQQHALILQEMKATHA